MRVNELANKLDVTADTVRYYTRIGILQPIKSIENGYKHYSKDDESRLRFVLKAKNLGFSVSEIQDIMTISEKGDSPCCEVRELVKKHIEQTNHKIAELEALKGNMTKAVDAWETIEDKEPDEQNICELIEMWDEIDLSSID